MRQLFSAEGKYVSYTHHHEVKSPSHMIMMRSECVRRYNKFSTGVVQFTLFIAADDESYRLPLHVRICYYVCVVPHIIILDFLIGRFYIFIANMK